MKKRIFVCGLVFILLINTSGISYAKDLNLINDNTERIEEVFGNIKMK